MKEILIVDDSPLVRKVARRLIEDMHLRAVEVEDGRAGLDACEKRMPDVILLDWRLPGMDGAQFMSSLRELRGAKPKVLFFATDDEDVGHIARAIHAGADDYFLKPFDQTTLRAKFEELGLV
jgi:two-component system chemotaxis response regulator CheY